MGATDMPRHWCISRLRRSHNRPIQTAACYCLLHGCQISVGIAEDPLQHTSDKVLLLGDTSWETLSNRAQDDTQDEHTDENEH